MPWNQAYRFTDPLQCRIQGSDFEIFPREKGDFLFEVTQVGMNRLWMGRYHVSVPQVDTLAVKPGRRVVAFLTEDTSTSLQYCGVELIPGDMIIHNFDLVHQRSDHNLHAGSMSLPIDELNATLESVVGDDLDGKLRKSIIRPSSAMMSRLLKLHRAVGQLAHDTPDILDQPEVRRALEEQLSHVMVRCLADGAGVETTTGGRRHHAIVARFEEYLGAHPDRPLYLTEICTAIGVAERTLRAACEEHLGMGPIRYLTLRRMYLARRALLGADACKTSVTRIVTDHGFWELGRFSVAYRSLFGESPSETLRRPAQQPEICRDRPRSRPTAAIAELS